MASGSAGICRYRLTGHHNGMTHGFRGGAPDLGRGDRSAICRSRRKVLRHFERGWFRGFVSEGSAVACKRGPRDRATVPTTKPGALRATCRSRRYGRASIGGAPAARDKTTKPPMRAGSRRSAPRTADGRTLTVQSDQGHRHVTIGSCRSDALQAGRTRQPTLRAVRRNHRGRTALLLCARQGRLSSR